MIFDMSADLKRGQIFSSREIATMAVDHFLAMQKPRELEGLISLARDTLRDDDVVVEIGCDAGGTLYAWTRIWTAVIGISLQAGPFSSGRQLFSFGATVIPGNSLDPRTRQAFVDQLRGRPVGLLFLDGDHSYDGVSGDFEVYGEYVRPGGLIAFHDICEHTGVDGVDVARLWRQLALDYPTDQFIADPRNWGGIGVLHVT